MSIFQNVWKEINFLLLIFHIFIKFEVSFCLPKVSILTNHWKPLSLFTVQSASNTLFMFNETKLQGGTDLEIWWRCRKSKNHETLTATFFETYFCRKGVYPHSPSMYTLPILIHNSKAQVASHRIKSTIPRFIFGFTFFLIFVFT